MVSAGCWFSNTHDLRTPPAMKMPVCSRNSIYSVVKERTRISGGLPGRHSRQRTHQQNSVLAQIRSAYHFLLQRINCEEGQGARMSVECLEGRCTWSDAHSRFG